MAPGTPRKRSTPSVSDLHRQWLELVDTDGPFLAWNPMAPLPSARFNNTITGNLCNVAPKPE